MIRPYLLLIAMILGSTARAELRELTIHRRVPFAEGKSFGEVGPYELHVGIAKFAVDPAHARNRDIVDLALAPRNAEGKVEFESDVQILAPKDPAKGNGALLYDVNNRGTERALKYFNLATAADPAGDGFLMRRGFTIVWSGWNGELLPGGGRFLLHAPVVPVRGIVRHEFATDAPADTLPLARREGHGSYPPTREGESNGVLTWRVHEGDPRERISRERWSLERMLMPKSDGVPATLGQIRIKLAGGFKPGYLYELVCESEGSIAQGLGFASVRDLVSHLRYDPVRAITRTHGFGVSQSGRFLREFLYLGFNSDESGRKVFDGFIPHVAGAGLGSFNHRFAQPTRMNAQHEEHLYPVDRFPFAYGSDFDPLTKQTDGILRGDTKHWPKVMHTQGAGEYWNRSGSLVHTNPLGTKDAAIPANVRLYTFGGVQHSPGSVPPDRGFCENVLNPADCRPFLRALLVALDAWIRNGTEPPPSIYPRIDDGTLVPWQHSSTRFPAIPGVRYPEVIQCPAVLDFGPEFATRGIITIEPPRVGEKYVVRVPKCDADGNDLGTLLPPEVAAPLATHTGWNLRRRDVGAEGMLALLMGSYFPLPRTRAGREASGDPRLSVEERYGSFENYQKKFRTVCDDEVRRRYLLKEDADRLLTDVTKLRGHFPSP